LFRSTRLTRELISRKDPDIAQLRAGTGTDIADSNKNERGKRMEKKMREKSGEPREEQ